MNKFLLSITLLLAINANKCGQQQPSVETEHLRLVPVTSTTDKAEIEDQEFFKRNGMDGAKVSLNGRPAIARHQTNGSWVVEYSDGSIVPAQMSLPSKWRFRLSVGQTIVAFEQLATVKEGK